MKTILRKLIETELKFQYMGKGITLTPGRLEIIVHNVPAYWAMEPLKNRTTKSKLEM